MTEPEVQSGRPALEDFREEIAPLATGDLHFTHAAVAVLPRRSIEAMGRYLGIRSQGIVSYQDVSGPLERCRELAAGLIHANPDEIAFTGSTADGANLVANGLRWQAGENVISADIEFPDNVYPWSYLERKGVEIRRVPHRDGRVPIDDLAAAMDERTRMIAISYVQFVSGFRIQLEGLAELCQSRGALLFLDAMQGLGALQLDMSRIPVDFLAVGGYKWLLGPMGTGLFYCRRSRLDELDVTSIGSGSMVQPKTYFPYRHEFRPEAARFEGAATKNFVGIFGLGASLELLHEAGPDRIEPKVLSLTRFVAEGLRSQGYRIQSPMDHDGERSGILCFDHHDHETPDLVARLAEAHIYVTSVEGRIRVAPHFFHCEDDLERLLDALPSRK